MIQFLNNIWIALSSENVGLVNFLMIPACVVEAYLFMKLFLVILNIDSKPKQKSLYTTCMAIVGIITTFFLSEPVNVLFNYSCIFLLILTIFKLGLLKSFLALIVSTFVFAIANILFQKLYLSALGISLNNFMNIPLYRFPYLIILYYLIGRLCKSSTKFKNINFDLDLFDTLDKKTLRLLIVNLIIGFLLLCIQLLTTAFFIDIVPTIISFLNFILLVAFMILSIYSFTRVIKLANARRDLASAEEYNKSLQNLYDEVKGFKHDFNNIVSTIDGYIENNDMTRLKKYFSEIKRDCKITNNLSLLNPSTINNPGIYSLLNNKYFTATNSGITFDIEVFLNLNTLDVNMYKFSRILGILIDNAIEEAEKCENKIVKISLTRENKNNRAIITIENTYSNKDVDIEKIFEKGKSGKENHSGIGLWEVRKYVSKSKNLDLFTSKTDEFFKQELSIYDIIKK